MATLDTVLAGRRFSLSVDDFQLQGRGVGDLITAEIVAVSTPPEEHSPHTDDSPHAGRNGACPDEQQHSE